MYDFVVKPNTYYARNRERVLQKAKAYQAARRAANREQTRQAVRMQVKRWRAENAQRNRSNVAEWKRKSRARAEYLISEFISNALLKYTMSLRKCSGAVEFMHDVFGMDRVWAEGWKLRTEGMEWDHVVPKSAFDLLNPEHLVRCCYWTNVRRISPEENMSKQNSTDCEDVMSLRWVGSHVALYRASEVIRKFRAKSELRSNKRV